jgi:hypothetical protein
VPRRAPAPLQGVEAPAVDPDPGRFVAEHAEANLLDGELVAGDRDDAELAMPAYRRSRLISEGFRSRGQPFGCRLERAVVGISGDCAPADVARPASANATATNRTMKTPGYIRSPPAAEPRVRTRCPKAPAQRKQRRYRKSSVCIGALCSDSAALPGVEERGLRFVELRGQQRESPTERQKWFGELKAGHRRNLQARAVLGRPQHQACWRGSVIGRAVASSTDNASSPIPSSARAALSRT